MKLSKYRSDIIQNSVVGFSISYQRDNLLARGLGLEHLRELLRRLARQILRQGADLAYGGHWKDTEDNFTFDLLRLISAEQEDNSQGGADTNLRIGKLFNHAAWPSYLEITPKIEAQWINCCQIVRITQQLAGFPEEEVVPDAKAHNRSPRTLFNAAVTLSAMRRLMMQPIPITIPDGPSSVVPPVVARILLGGKVDGYSGFLPGIFEEALVTMQRGRPLYILGGFGGAAEVLAKAMLASGSDRPPEFTLAWQEARNPALVRLLESTKEFQVPSSFVLPGAAFDQLFSFVERARTNLSGTLETGLDDAQTRELLTTRNVDTAVRLVRTGLENQEKLLKSAS